uniref:Uncharacterized protein n=1 Tax=Ciona savignyi TaxID=51511 RepID=H2YTD5_CIOSA
QACQPKPQVNLFTGKPSNGNFRFCRWGKLYTGDFNNDGRSDILCYYRNDWVRIGLGPSSTTYPSVHWEGPTRLCKFSPSSSKPGKVFVADFNADGKEDLMCMDSESGKMRILFNGNRSFHSEEVNWKGEFPNFCTAAENIFAEDVDGDGDADLLCRKSSGYISILKNQFK